MDFPPFFHRELRLAYPTNATALIAQTESNFRNLLPEVAFAAKSANPIDRRLSFCAYFLATIQTLESHGASFDEIRALSLKVTEAYVQPRSQLKRSLRRLPSLILRTPFAKLLSTIMRAKAKRLAHPDGFRARILKPPHETQGLPYGFDILECGIVKLFRKHNAAHYAPILCEVDRLTSSLAGLEMVRQGTIANGAPVCDFRFKILR